MAPEIPNIEALGIYDGKPLTRNPFTIIEEGFIRRLLLGASVLRQRAVVRLVVPDLILNSSNHEFIERFIIHSRQNLTLEKSVLVDAHLGEDNLRVLHRTPASLPDLLLHPAPLLSCNSLTKGKIYSKVFPVVK